MLAVTNVARSYSGRDALQGVTAEFGVGVTALLGRNGAGKSTLMRILATVDHAYKGQFTHDDIELSGRKLRRFRRKLGWLPQSPAVPVHSTVEAYVDYVAWLRGVPRQKRRSAVATALAAVDLSERSQERIGTLSGGMTRRLGLAQAIVNRPSVLLLDEPTAGLDPEQRQSLGYIIRTVGERAHVIIATHLLEDVAIMADSVVLLGAGRVKFSGPIEDFAGLSRQAITVESLSQRFRSLAGTEDTTQ